MVSPAALVKVLLAAASLAAGEPALSPGPNPLSGTGAARASSPAAAARDLPLLPERPAPPKEVNPTRWEYVTVVTLLSAPFTALWYGLVFGIVEIFVQHGRVPPKFTTPMYEGLCAVAGATSLGIALVSVHWGGQGRDLSATASVAVPIPTPAASHG
jgi:hypothetical protein